MSSATAGFYLYAIVDGDGVVPEICGIDDEPIRAVVCGSLAAMVSPLRSARLRPERRNLMAHQKALAAFGVGRGVLPMRFGVILPDEQKVQRIIDIHQADLLRQLDRVRGRVEMGLRVKWKAEEVFTNLMDLDPALRHVREGLPDTREAAIDLGKQVADALERQRLAQQSLLHEVFGAGVIEFCFNAPKDDAQLVNAACLIVSDGAAEFEAGVHRLAALLDDRYLIDFNGPWAAHNFILLNMALDGHA